MKLGDMTQVSEVWLPNCPQCGAHLQVRMTLDLATECWQYAMGCTCQVCETAGTWGYGVVDAQGIGCSKCGHYALRTIEAS